MVSVATWTSWAGWLVLLHGLSSWAGLGGVVTCVLSCIGESGRKDSEGLAQICDKDEEREKQ